MRLIHPDAGEEGGQILGEEELKVVGRVCDLDPANTHRLIPRFLQAFDALAEAERGDPALSAVPLPAVIDAGQVTCRHGTARDGEGRAAMERVSAHRVRFAPAREQSDQSMPLHGDDSTQSVPRRSRARCVPDGRVNKGQQRSNGRVARDGK